MMEQHEDKTQYSMCIFIFFSNDGGIKKANPFGHSGPCYSMDKLPVALGNGVSRISSVRGQDRFFAHATKKGKSVCVKA